MALSNTRADLVDYQALRSARWGTRRIRGAAVVLFGGVGNGTAPAADCCSCGPSAKLREPQFADRTNDMHTLTEEEFLRAPLTLLDAEHRSAATLLTVQGQPLLMAVPLNNGVPVQAALVDLAATLYDRELISLGKAARIAGMSYSEMINELGARGIATIRLAPGELERELAAFGP